MKLVIFGVIAFVIGLGASVGVAVMKAPPPQAAADSSAADSLHHPEPVGASPVSTAGGPDSTHAGSSADSSHRRVAARGDSSAIFEVAEVANQVALDTPEQKAHRSQLYKRVARILAAMKPKESAAILERLDDDQLEGIIRALGVRQAATTMAQIPAERAAEMSRRIIEEPLEEEP